MTCYSVSICNISPIEWGYPAAAAAPAASSCRKLAYAAMSHWELELLSPSSSVGHTHGKPMCMEWHTGVDQCVYAGV